MITRSVVHLRDALGDNFLRNVSLCDKLWTNVVPMVVGLVEKSPSWAQPRTSETSPL